MFFTKGYKCIYINIGAFIVCLPCYWGKMVGDVVGNVGFEFLGFDDLDVVGEADDETGDAAKVGDWGVEKPMIIVVDEDLAFGQGIFL